MTDDTLFWLYCLIIIALVWCGTGKNEDLI